MPASIHAVELRRTKRLDRYHALEHVEAQLEEVTRLGLEVRHLMGTARLWMVNSTRSGGGVAEMLPPLCELLAEVGVDTRWLVLEPSDPEFFAATKALHNMIHGVAPVRPLSSLPEVYERTSREAAAALVEHVESGDILVVHDPQPLGLARYLPASHRPALVWRCHIGLAHHNAHTEAAWQFLAPYLEPYNRLVYSSERYIPPGHEKRSGIIHPAIDPLSHKNRELRLYKQVGILRSAELVDGPPVADWARFVAPARRYHGDWVAEPIPDLLHAPILLQVSRFDRLKGFQHLIPAFTWLLEHGAERALHMRVDSVRAAAELQRAMLVLAGPDPQGVLDDPEAVDVLEGLCRQWDALPPELASRVHLVRLPMVHAKQNALMVNALQRAATVVVQDSLEEGFGLTVTEALWKGAPVVASNVGGIAHQIRRGTDGLLVDDPQDPAAVGAAVAEQMFLRARADAMAHCARRRVAEHFLVVTQVRRWLEELKDVLVQRGAKA